TVTPTKSGSTFTPATRSVTVASANVAGVTFTASCGTGTTLFTDGFEGTGWSSVDTSGTAGTWTFASSSTYPTTTPHGGTKLAKFNSYNAASGSQTRVYRTAGFAVASSYTSVSLKFWMYHDTGYSTYNDRIQVQISTNGSTWSIVGTAVSRYTGSTGWAQATIDLSAYKGQTVYLGFLGISAYGNNITLDDVTVSAQ
ncbi:MAG: choice-of-anchor J domain-containing protein, partial [Deltaproteobacteria bacterium]|nr:choice-of-anchor J domain-containing protein [Deltaproteobacteria bacterium]